MARCGARSRRGRWSVRAFRWHLLAFVALNTVLEPRQCASPDGPGGRSGRWSLTSLLLAVHYLLYKAVTVDEHWAEERVEELNLKSYDRSHIEELKARHVPKKANPADHRD